jgi:DNA-binding GntR family transcriptional regulator
MSFAKLEEAHRRRIVLDALRQDADYSINESLLRGVLRQFGFSVSRDLMRTDLAWLVEQGLITSSETGGVLVARITNRGDDVASGCIIVPGVARPEPESL